MGFTLKYEDVSEVVQSVAENEDGQAALRRDVSSRLTSLRRVKPEVAAGEDGLTPVFS